MSVSFGMLHLFAKGHGYSASTIRSYQIAGCKDCGFFDMTRNNTPLCLFKMVFAQGDVYCSNGSSPSRFSLFILMFSPFTRWVLPSDFAVKHLISHWNRQQRLFRPKSWCQDPPGVQQDISTGPLEVSEESPAVVAWLWYDSCSPFYAPRSVFLSGPKIWGIR